MRTKFESFSPNGFASRSLDDVVEPFVGSHQSQPALWICVTYDLSQTDDGERSRITEYVKVDSSMKNPQGGAREGWKEGESLFCYLGCRSLSHWENARFWACLS